MKNNIKQEENKIIIYNSKYTFILTWNNKDWRVLTKSEK